MLLLTKERSLAAIFQQELAQTAAASVLHLAGPSDVWNVLDQLRTVRCALFA